MHQQDHDITVRLGRSAAKHLRSLCENHALTEPDARRLLDRIDAAFAIEQARVDRAQGLTVIQGGRS